MSIVVHHDLGHVTARGCSPRRAVERNRTLEEITTYSPSAAVAPVRKLGDRHAERLVVTAALRKLDAEPGMVLGHRDVAEEVSDRPSRPMDPTRDGSIGS